MSGQYDDRRKANQERLDRLLAGLVDSDEANEESVEVVGVNPCAPTSLLVGVPEDEPMSPRPTEEPITEVPSSPPDWDEDQAAVGDRPQQDAEM